MKLLKKINNINKECSDFNKQDFSKTENNTEKDDNLFIADESEFSDRNNEKENIMNKCREQKAKRLLLSSESESDVKD